MKQEIDLENIDKLIIESIDTIEVGINNDDKTATINLLLNPYHINGNFKELDERLAAIESQLKLRYYGELNNIKSKIENLERIVTEIYKRT